MKPNDEISTKKAVVVGVAGLTLVALMAVAICTAGSRNNHLPVNSGVVSGMQPMMSPDPGQLAAFQQNGLTLPMGVTLVGRGTVDSLVPGSPAERAGIQVGDIINRINGR